MRKVIFGINISLDGCVDHTMISNPGEEVHQYFTDLMNDVDVLVYGRKTYELMVPFWPDYAKSNTGSPDAMSEFAKAFDADDKMVVFSRTLEKAEGKNTRIVRGGLKEEILKLKQEEGKDISTGGVDIPSQLMELGLIDEYHFVVHPIMAGEGRRLLEGINLQETLQLRLVETKLFKSGCIALRYVKQ